MKTLILISIILCLNCSAQKQSNIWYFGDSAGISFNNGTPISLLDGQITFPSGHSHIEGTSSISDSSGSILFYSDGMTVWNKNHQIMQNGTDLLGNFSSTQSSIIVPDPADANNQYYLFTVSSGFCCGGSSSDGLRYSKIDMCLDNDNGGIIQGKKNIKLMDDIVEKIAVTRHSNGIDYWIVSHKFNSDEFWALKLTKDGIVDTVISAIGSIHNGHIAGTQGQMKISSTGDKIAIGASNGLDILDVFDFNNSTGNISNYSPLFKPNNNKSSIYGLEFSSNSSKLYINGTTTFGNTYAFLAQYDLSAGGGNLDSINTSLNIIYRDTVGIISSRGLQIGPDNKIYFVSINDNTTLSVIHNPNFYDIACNYEDKAISLKGRRGSMSLPSCISGFDYSNTIVQCISSGIDIQTACQAFTWIDSNTYTADNNTATFNIIGGASNGGDSVVSLNLTINTVVSSVTQVGKVLNADESGAMYQWINCPEMTPINGAISQSYNAEIDGNYAVIVTKDGCIDTSICHSIITSGIIGNNFGNKLLLYPNPINCNFSIDLGKSYNILKISLTDINGKIVQSKTYRNSQLLNLELNKSPGIYNLVIESIEKKAIIRLVKK